MRGVSRTMSDYKRDKDTIKQMPSLKHSKKIYCFCDVCIKNNWCLRLNFSMCEEYDCNMDLCANCLKLLLRRLGDIKEGEKK
jgi:hypothetical protein